MSDPSTGSGLPWVRFFPSDWLAGTRRLSAAETGIYITLVATMYDHGKPVQEVPGLARLCRASNATFRIALETLVAEGKIIRTDAGLWNERVGAELKERRIYAARQKANAKAGWSKRTAGQKSIGYGRLNREKSRVETQLGFLQNEKNASDINENPMPRQCHGNANHNHITGISTEDVDIPKRAADAARVEKTAVAAYSTLARKIGLPAIKALSDTRKRKLHAIIARHGIDAWNEALAKLEASDFCRGGGGRGWLANFDFLVQPSSFVKLLEGQFDNRPVRPNGPSPPWREAEQPGRETEFLDQFIAREAKKHG